LSSLLGDGYVTKSRVLALQREQAQLDGERGQALAEVSRAQQGIGEANRQILQIENQRREDVSKELHATEGQLDDLAQRRIATQDVVTRLDIPAPMNGTVANLNVHTIGGVISPSTALMEIVPSNDKLMVEAEVNPRDIDTLKIGQQVSLRIATAEARMTPVIFGKLDEISRDRIPTQNGRGAYKIRVSIPATEAARLGDVNLHVGMPVEAFVSSGSQTALHYALKPLLDSLARSFRER
jgi:HlyD family secretion protein